MNRHITKLFSIFLVLLTTLAVLVYQFTLKEDDAGADRERRRIPFGDGTAMTSRAADSDSAADLVLLNGRVYTVTGSQPWAEAVAVRHGRITLVGGNADVQARAGAATRVIDLHGRLLLPGFQDAHIHPLEGNTGNEFFPCGLEPGKDPEFWIEPIRACAADANMIEWVLGWGHAINDLLGRKRLPRAILDEAVPDRPVAIMEYTSHSLWVNTIALAAVGYDRETPNPPGGVIVKDPVTGEPNGILLDSAGDNLLHRALQATPVIQAARYRALLRAQDMLAENGITAITNARVYWRRGNLDTWLRAAEDGVLKARTVLALWTYPDMDDEIQLARLKSMYDNNAGAMLRVSQIKFYSDGLIFNNTAAVLQPYTETIFPFSNPHGLNYFTEPRMTRYITELERVGFDVHIHAIGDRAVRESLNAIAGAQTANRELKRQRRHQITHVSMVHPDDVARFADLGVIANIQINFDPADTQMNEDSPRSRARLYRLIGHRNFLTKPVRAIHDAGGTIVMSSDWDVSDISPLLSIDYFVNHYGRVGHESDLDDSRYLIDLAIRAYTRNAAYAMHHDRQTGTIETGKYADLVVLDKNLFALPTDQIKDIRVVLTILGGQITYQRDQ